MRPIRPLAAVLLAAALLAGCTSGDDAADSTATGSITTTASPSSTAPTGSAGAGSSSGSTSGSSPSPGCAPSGAGVPDGAPTAPTLDVDGDGSPDTVWIDDETDVGGGVVFGIATASGASFSTDFNSPSGQNARSVLVADVTGEGELIALASDGRAVRLYALSDCSLIPVQNVQGEQYTFDLGFTGFGTGVGCADVDGDGTRDLVGLQADGTTVTSTVVQLNGPRAANGASRTITDATPEQIDLARQVTCGDLTLVEDGVAIGA